MSEKLNIKNVLKTNTVVLRIRRPTAEQEPVQSLGFPAGNNIATEILAEAIDGEVTRFHGICHDVVVTGPLNNGVISVHFTESQKADFLTWVVELINPILERLGLLCWTSIWVRPSGAKSATCVRSGNGFGPEDLFDLSDLVADAGQTLSVPEQTQNSSTQPVPV